MLEVVPFVFIGDFDATKPHMLTKHRIARVLSVCPQKIEELPETITHHMQLPVNDEPNVNLIELFPQCVEFIQKSREAEKNVLVHCFAGISRSATIVMAFMLADMKLDCPGAFKMLKTVWPRALPNEGFRTQLKLFYRMKCALDDTDGEYKLFRLQHLAEERNFTKIQPSDFAADPATLNTTESTYVVRCKKCRRKLATEVNLLSHEAGSGQVAFRWRKRDEKSLGVSCTSIFMEPISWIKELENGEIEGKIHCPKCSVKVGFYNWAGMQCSCGCWINPCFQLQLSKVDCLPNVSPPLREALPSRPCVNPYAHKILSSSEQDDGRGAEKKDTGEAEKEEGQADKKPLSEEEDDDDEEEEEEEEEEDEEDDE